MPDEVDVESDIDPMDCDERKDPSAYSDSTSSSDTDSSSPPVLCRTNDRRERWVEDNKSNSSSSSFTSSSSLSRSPSIVGLHVSAIHPS